MNDSGMHTMKRTGTALVAGLTLFLSVGAALAENAGGQGQALLPAPVPENQTVLARRLSAAKKDMEALRLFAESFRKSRDTKALAQLQKPTDELLSRHVDNLLLQGDENWTLETSRLSAEVMLLKARLLASLDRGDAAREVIADMRKRFGAQKISMEVSGKTTTLDEAIRLLENELAVPEKPEKTKG
jgi:hypothetical protein